MEIIHIVLGKANPNRMNGVNKVVHQLATHQAIAGKKVSVWGFAQDLVNNYGARKYTTKLFKAKTNLFSLDINFKKELNDLTQDVVFHIHGGWIPTFYSVAKLLVKNNFEYVVTPHGAYNTIAMNKNKIQKKIYFKAFEKWLLDHTKAIHCIGQSEIEGLSKIYTTNKTKLLPYGFKVEKAIALNNNKENFVFGFLGRIDIYTKGLDLMLEAFQQSCAHYPHTRLWIVGDSDQKLTLLSKARELGVSEKIVFWGAKYGEEKMEILSRMDVFLHPSRNEGLPTAVLEAASIGIPSIVTKATNVGEYVKKLQAGICIDNDNVKALSISMKFLMNCLPTKLKSMGENAKKMLKQEFAWNHIVNQFELLY